jgi:hypothetical protein
MSPIIALGIVALIIGLGLRYLATGEPGSLKDE